MSVFNHNYNNFNTESDQPSARDRIQDQMQQLNNTVSPELQLTTIQNRAFERIEIDPARAVAGRAQELISMGLQGGTGLDTFRTLIDQASYGQKFVAAAETKARLWEQKVGTVKPNEVTNPAVVQQIRQSIDEGENVSEFIPGGQFNRQLREDQQVVTPETAEALDLIAKQQGNYAAKEKYSGYYSRPGVKEYTDLFTRGTAGVTGVFFQFSNSQLLSNLLSKKELGFDILTQQMDEMSFNAKDRDRANILAGNELMLGIARNGLLPENQNVYGIKSPSSFHPKIGYTTRREEDGTLTYNMSYISTQNITPALSNNKTIESMLVFDANSTMVTEKRAAQEIVTYTDYLMKGAKDAEAKGDVYTSVTLDFSKSMFEGNQYLYTNRRTGGGFTETSRRYSEVIRTAAEQRTDDKVVISMGKITEGGINDSLEKNLLTLAKEGRLIVSVDQRQLKDMMSGRDSLGIINELADYGSLQVVPTEYLHEKTMAVFNNQNQLMFKSLGSANLTGRSQTGSNTEVVVAFGLENYADKHRRSNLSEEEQLELEQQDTFYLRNLQGYGQDIGSGRTSSDYMKHVSFVTGGKFNNIRSSSDIAQGITPTPLYTTGYLNEMPSKYIAEEKQRVARIEQLAADIKRNNVSGLTGHGNVDVEFRYSPDSKLQTYGRGADGKVPLSMSPVGLRVTIESPEGSHKLSMDLTVNTEGAVMMSDLNKFLNKTLYVNSSDQTQVLFEQGAGSISDIGVRKQELMPGQSTKLNSFETAVAMINTIQRQFVYQSEYALNDMQFDLLKRENYIDANNAAQKFLASEFQSMFPEKSISIDGGRRAPTNLATFLYELINYSDASTKSTIASTLVNNIASKKYGPSSTLFMAQQDMRLKPLSRFAESLQSDLNTDFSRRIKMLMEEGKVLDVISVSGGTKITKEGATLLAQELGNDLLNLLSVGDEEKALSDIKKALVYSNEASRKAYLAAAKTQSRALMSELTAPYLSAHENTYSAYQAMSRMPVMGESTNFGLVYQNQYSEVGRFMQQGILNPLEYGHTTKISEAGQLWRALGSSAYGKKLEMPGIGALRQLNILDSDMSAGAGVVHDYDDLAGSISNLRKISLADVRGELNRLVDAGLMTNEQMDMLLKHRQVELLFRNELAVGEENEEGAVELMYSSFAKAERLTQRIKNLSGARPTVDLNKDFLRQALGRITTDQSMYDFYKLGEAPGMVNRATPMSNDADNIISGRLRIALSSKQIQKVKEIRKMLAQEKARQLDIPYAQAETLVGFDEVQTYFRDAMLHMDRGQHGFIGPAELKRVALVAGPNLLSDPNYMNAGYDQLAGSVQRSRAKLNLNRLGSALGDQTELARIFEAGGIVTTRSFTQEGVTYDPGYYIRNQEGELERVGKYGRDGFIQFDNIYETYTTPFGEGKRAYSLKYAAFGKKAEGGITVVQGIPNLTTTSRGMNILELNTYTYKQPGSGNRISGEDGLGKGPFDILEEKFFNLADKVFLDEAYRGQEGEALMNLMQVRSGAPASKQKTYAMMSISNFKGFAVRGGASMIGSEIEAGRPSSFLSLMEQDGIQVAKSLSLMFLGDEKVRDALADTVADPIRKAAIKNKHDKVDISGKGYAKGNTTMDNMLLSATGFLGLSSDPTATDLGRLKQDIVDALQPTPEGRIAANKLADRARKLLLAARSSGIEYGGAVDYRLNKDGTLDLDGQIPVENLSKSNRVGKGAVRLRQQVQLDDADGLVKAASVYASMSLFGAQLIGQRDVAERLSIGSKFSTNELPLDMVDVYHGRTLQRDKATGKITSIELDKTQLQGYSPQQYQNTINMIQGHLGERLFNLEKYFDADGRLIEQDAEQAMQEYEYNEMILRGLQSTVGQNVVLYMQADMTLSQSLVPTGMSDSVKAEYASYIGLSERRLRMFRDPLGLGDNEQAKNVQHAYFMILGLLDKNLYSISESEASARATFKLPFVAKDSSIEAAQKLGQYNTFLRQDELDLFSLAYLYSSGKGQVDRYTRKAVQEVFKLGIARDEGKLYGQGVTTMTDYATQAYKMYEEASLEDKINLANGTELDVRGVNKLIETKFASPGGMASQDYVSGLVAVEEALIKEITRAKKGSREREQLTQARLSVATSKNIIIPNLAYGNFDPETGLYEGQIRAFSGETPPTIGMLLGTDILAKMSMVFGDHESEIIQSQSTFLTNLIEAQPLLTKLQGKTRVQINQEEIRQYEDLIESSRNAYASLTKVIMGDTTRQAFGDHEIFKGAVSIPVNTNLLNPWEMVVGDRLLRLTGDDSMPQIAKLMDDMNFKFATGRADDRDIESMRTLIETYSAVVDPRTNKTVTLSKADVKNLLTVNPNDGDIQSRMQDAYSKILINKGIRDEFDTLDVDMPQRKLNINERKMMLTAKVLSKMVDMGYDSDIEAENAILGHLLSDSIDFKKDPSQLPTTLAEVMDDVGSYKNKKMQFTMARLAQLGLGAISQRTGHPGGSAAAVAERDNYQLTTVAQANQRAVELYRRRFGKDPEALMLSDQERSGTIMKVPTISRFLSMLGDYDGDSHRIIVNKSGNLLGRINALTKKSQMLDQQSRILNQVSEIDMSMFTASMANLDNLKASELVNISSEFVDKIRPLQTILNRSVLKNLDYEDLGMGNTDDFILDIKRQAQMLNNLSQMTRTTAVDADAMYSTGAEMAQAFLNVDGASPQNLQDTLLNLADNLTEATPVLQERFKEQQAEIEAEIYGDQSSGIEGLWTRVAAYAESKKVVEARQMNDIKEFVSTYTGLPKFVTGQRGGQQSLDLGTMASLISQKASLDGIKDHAGGSNLSRTARTAAMAFLFSEMSPREEVPTDATFFESVMNDRQKFYDAMKLLEGNKSEEVLKKFNLTNEALINTGYVNEVVQDGAKKLVVDEKLFMEEIGMLKDTAGKLGVSDPEQLIYDTYGMVYNYSTAFATPGEAAKKASGETLDPFQFDAAVRGIGEGGSKLIGDAYNTLMPLLDQSMIEAPFLVKSSTANEIFLDYSSQLEGSELATYQSMASKMGVDIGQGGDLQANRAQLKRKFYGTVGVVSSFQQIVRDALKPPGDGNSADLFVKELFPLNFKDEQTGIEMTKVSSLAEILSWSDKNYDVETQDRVRRDAMRNFLGLVLGTNLELDEKGQDRFVDPSSAVINNIVNPDSKAAQYLRSVEGVDWVKGMTGFGALMMLSDYTTTKEGEFFNKFIKNEEKLYGYSEEDFNKWKVGQGGSLSYTGEVSDDQLAREFIKTRIVNLMQRTQAGFAAESIRSAGKTNPGFLMDRALTAATELGFESKEIKGYADILSEYRDFKTTDFPLMNEKERQFKEYTFLNKFLYRKLQEEQAQTGSFTTESVEYLRTVKQDLMIMEQTGRMGATETQLMSVAAINNAIVRLRRGKIADIREATTFASFKTGAIADILDKGGFDADTVDAVMSGEFDAGKFQDKQQATAAAMLLGLVQQTPLSDDEKRLLAQTLANRDPEGQLGLKKFATESAALSQYYKLLESAAQENEPNTRSWNEIHQELDRATMSDMFGDTFRESPDVIPTDLIREMQGMDSADQIRALENQQATLVQEIKTQQMDAKHNQMVGKLRANYAAEAVGILGSPLLFAIAGSGMKMDERALGFGIDVIQGLAEVGARTSTTSQFLGDFQSQAQGFTTGRMRHALDTEGILAGSLQAVGQEMMFRSISELSGAITQQTVGRMSAKAPDIATVGTSIAAEVVGSVLAQGVSKALFKAKGSPKSKPVSSAITRMLSNFIEEVWRAAEDAQLQLLEEDYIVLDTDANEQIDFDLDANPGDTWFDMESGLVLIDDSGSAIESNFEDNDTGYMQTAGAARFAT